MYCFQRSDGMEKGQVAQETIAAVAILLIVFVLVTNQYVERYNQGLELGASNTAKIECEKISTMISFVNMSPGNDSVRLGNISNDFNISGNVVKIRDRFCDFFGDAQDATLSEGNVLIYEANGGAVVENV
ncbi:MAG: hypothetical protein ABID38_05115 [Candidatus Diapherotrites archaeon]